jgi:hypothetical protein
MSESLHTKYVPVLHFAQQEQFYPMGVDDFLAYCTLRRKGETAALLDAGQVTPALLARAYRRNSDLYVQSVPASLADQNVTSRWGSETLATLSEFSMRAAHWQEGVARLAYRWFSEKTQSATKLFWWNDLVMPLVGSGRRGKEDLPRLDLPPEIRDAAARNYQASQPGRPQYTYYYRLVRDGRYLCLQYWFFYGYNDWATGFGGMNDHEGDWEGVYFFFDVDASGRPIEPPAYVTFVGHHSRLTKPWGHPDITMDGTHPVGYVAAGSHATYPERKEYDLIKIYGLTDYATGGGRTIEPGDWRRRIDLDTQPWTVGFLGGWGTRYWLPASAGRLVFDLLKATRADKVDLPGISAPRGPRYTDEGTVRPNWTRVVDWAGIAELRQG